MCVKCQFEWCLSAYLRRGKRPCVVRQDGYILLGDREICAVFINPLPEKCLLCTEDQRHWPKRINFKFTRKD